MGGLGSPQLAIARLIAYLAVTLFGLPFQILAVLTGSRLQELIPLIYHRICARILGLEIVVLGQQATDRPVLFVANHSSYLDITILGGLIRGSFVAKVEVGSWPLFGLLAKLQRSVFVDRRRESTDRQRRDLRDRLDRHENLILFPEGTSNDGNFVLPFKSALFTTAQHPVGGKHVLVQPVSVAFTLLDGMPVGRALRPFYAWYGDMDLVSHIWRLAGLGTVRVEVHFHPPVRWDDFADRKALTQYCQAVVSAGVAASLFGREPRDLLPPAYRDGPPTLAAPSAVSPDTEAVSQ